MRRAAINLTSDNCSVVANGLQFPEGPIAMPDGTLLVVEIARGTLTRLWGDGRLEVVAKLGGGPNGAAIGPDGHCYICNNGGLAWVDHPERGLTAIGQPTDYVGGSIDRVDLSNGRVERLYEQVDGRSLRGPNDIVFDAFGGFWFTDMGKLRHRDIDRGSVFYAKADGSFIEEVIFPMLMPNGVGLSQDGNTLYVSETVTSRLWEFTLDAPGRIARQPFPSPNGGSLIHAEARYRTFDSLAVDSQGSICIATLMEGGITVVPTNGGNPYFLPTDDVFTTNICFGGPRLETAFITLSGSGRVIAAPWPNGGLPLNFLNVAIGR